jgi:hypothetical protein
MRRTISRRLAVAAGVLVPAAAICASAAQASVALGGQVATAHEWTIAVGQYPTSVAADTANGTVWVADESGNAVPIPSR